MTRFATTSILALSLHGCLAKLEVQRTAEVESVDDTVLMASLLTGVTISDQTCNFDSSYSGACSESSIPIFQLPSCSGGYQSALPVIDLPLGLNPADCDVDVVSAGTVAFNMDSSWRNNCAIQGDGSYQCYGNAYVTSETAANMGIPLNHEGTLTIRCSGYEPVSTDLLYAAQAPAMQFYAMPSCANPVGGDDEIVGGLGIGEVMVLE